jgi:hypothetical protein
MRPRCDSLREGGRHRRDREREGGTVERAEGEVVMSMNRGEITGDGDGDGNGNLRGRSGEILKKRKEKRRQMKIRGGSSSVMGGHYALGYMLFLVPLSLTRTFHPPRREGR